MNKENKEKIIIYTDFDNTICNSTQQLVRLLNLKFNTSVDWREVKMYNCQDTFPNITHQEILDIFGSEEFFQELEFYDGFLATYEKFKDYFQYNISTIGTSNNLYYKKIWCEKNITVPFVWNGIEKIGMGKSCIDMQDSIIIDDHIDNLRSSNAKYKILYKGEHDTDWNCQNEDEGFIEAMNWEDVEMILNHIIVHENYMMKQCS